MHNLSYVGRKLEQILSYSYNKACSLLRFQRVLCVYMYQFILFHLHPFFIHLIYFIILSLLGYLALKALRPIKSHDLPNDFDLFFTSVSVSTLTCLSVIEPEVFSKTQLIIIIILMLLGGKIFTSMIGLIFAWFNLPMYQNNTNSINGSNPNSRTLDDQVVLCGFSTSDSESQGKIDQVQNLNVETLNLKRNSMRYMVYVVLGYQIIVQSIGFILVFLYFNMEVNAKEILKNKDISILTFSILIVISSFTNCGFVPINENMTIFIKNSSLLLLLTPQILLGNTLYPPCLRLVTWALGKCTKKDEYFYILNNHRDMGYHHMFYRIRSCQLTITIMGLIVTQLLLLFALESNSNNTIKGLNSYQKFVAFLFQATNSRHAGESVLDLSTVSTAMMLLFTVFMYLPTYTTFSPILDEVDYNRNHKKSTNMKNSIVDSLVLSHISLLAIFVICICITERDKLEQDPLNFNLLSTLVEVVGAYGNAGLSIGYRCDRQLEAEHSGKCKQTLNNLSANYSVKGKTILILVMLFGKLKNFNCNGGKAWTLY